MEFIDTHSVVIFGVLLVHLMGVIVVAASAVALVAALFVVVLAVHGYRNMWSARRPGKQGRSGDDLAAQRLSKRDTRHAHWGSLPGIAVFPGNFVEMLKNSSPIV